MGKTSIIRVEALYKFFENLTQDEKSIFVLGICNPNIKKAAIKFLGSCDSSKCNSILQVLKRNKKLFSQILHFTSRKRSIVRDLKGNELEVNVDGLSVRKCDSEIEIICKKLGRKKNFKNMYNIKKQLINNTAAPQEGKEIAISPQNVLSKNLAVPSESVISKIDSEKNLSIGHEIHKHKGKINIISNILLAPEIITNNSIFLQKQFSEYSTAHQHHNDCDRCIGNASSNFEYSDEYFIDKYDQNISSDEEIIPLASMTFADEKSSGGILPHGSLNRREENACPTSYKYCNFFEGSFVLSSDEFCKIHERNDSLGSKWAYLLSKKVQLINNTCTINFRSKRFAKTKDQFIIYAYCAHMHCKKFIMKIFKVSEGSVHPVDVFSTSRDYNHMGKITKHLKGLERNIAKRDLLYMRPSQSKETRIKRAVSLLIQEGNLQHIKSDCVLRKARSEKFAELDRSKDDMIDLLLMQRDNRSYMQVVGDPFHVFMYSNEQLDILFNYIQNERKLPVLHLDATGNIVKKPEFVTKRILYYVGVINVCGVVCPLLEMISCNYNTVSIGVWLIKFKCFVLKYKNRWPVFHHVVTDYSYASMNAVLRFFAIMIKPIFFVVRQIPRRVTHCKVFAANQLICQELLIFVLL